MMIRLILVSYFKDLLVVHPENIKQWRDNDFHKTIRLINKWGSTMDEKYDSMIQPHGGQLIDREYLDKERLDLLNHARMMPSLTVSAWEISDIELIGIGGFSPLTGFMKESDYLSVIHNVRLENGLVW